VIIRETPTVLCRERRQHHAVVIKGKMMSYYVILLTPWLLLLQVQRVTCELDSGNNNYYSSTLSFTDNGAGKRGADDKKTRHSAAVICKYNGTKNSRLAFDFKATVRSAVYCGHFSHALCCIIGTQFFLNRALRIVPV